MQFWHGPVLQSKSVSHLKCSSVSINSATLTNNNILLIVAASSCRAKSYIVAAIFLSTIHTFSWLTSCETAHSAASVVRVPLGMSARWPRILSEIKYIIQTWYFKQSYFLLQVWCMPRTCSRQRQSGIRWKRPFSACWALNSINWANAMSTVSDLSTFFNRLFVEKLL